MALAPFAKAADLKVLAPALDDDTADLVLDLVSAGIRASVGWDVDKVTGVTYERVIPFKRRGTAAMWSVVLPAVNVTAVSQVVVDGVTLTDAQWDSTTAGIVYLQSPCREKVTVTYTAGYQRAPADAVPAVFRTCALEYASRLAGNPGGVKSYTMGGVSETFADDARTMADQDSRLDTYRVFT